MSLRFKMRKADNRYKMLAYLRRNQFVAVRPVKLSEETGVSLTTVRRNLRKMLDRAMVERGVRR